MAKIVVSPEMQCHSEFIARLPEIFDQEGVVIYSGRNVLKRFEDKGDKIIVKNYRNPLFFNRFIYRFFRKPKAQRSFEYAGFLRNNNIGSPQPVGYYIETRGLFIGKTYYACLESTLRFTYRDLMKQEFDNRDEILRAVAFTTADLHQLGIIHKDYSAGNILFDTIDGEVMTEIIDLNRIRFDKNIDIKKGVDNFDRLPGTPEMLRIISDAYADMRDFDTKECWKIMQDTHGKDNKYIKSLLSH